MQKKLAIILQGKILRQLLARFDQNLTRKLSCDFCKVIEGFLQLYCINFYCKTFGICARFKTRYCQSCQEHLQELQNSCNTVSTGYDQSQPGTNPESHPDSSSEKPRKLAWISARLTANCIEKVSKGIAIPYRIYY